MPCYSDLLFHALKHIVGGNSHISDVGHSTGPVNHVSSCVRFLHKAFKEDASATSSLRICLAKSMLSVRKNGATQPKVKSNLNNIAAKGAKLKT